MKKYISSLCFVLCAMAVQGQSFSSLWKQFNTTSGKDLPKTEQKILKQIIQKAEKERSYGNLLAAEVKYINRVVDVSPDSMDSEVARLSKHAAAAEAKDKVLSAVYSAVLSKYYAYSDTEKAKEYSAKAMANPKLLAEHKYQEYLPFIAKGHEDAIFNNDLLHVIGFETGSYQALDKYYSSVGNRPAACITAAKRFDFGTITKAQLDSLIHRYGDLSECGQIAYYYYKGQIESLSDRERFDFLNSSIEKWQTWAGVGNFKNALNDLIEPMFEMQNENQRGYANTENTVRFNLRNLRNLKVTITKTNLDSGDSGNEMFYKKTVKGAASYVIKGSEQTISRSYPEHSPYEIFTDSFSLPKLLPGIYVIKATADGEKLASHESFYRVSNIYLLAEELPDSVIRYVAVDALTGQPIANAGLRLYGYTKSLLATPVTNAKGEATFSYKNREKPYWVYASTATDKALPDAELNSYFSYYSPSKQHLTCEIFTDRALYRPGQVVHSSVIVYEINNESKTRKALANRQIMLTLYDANSKEVGKKHLTTDAFGAASADFNLPKSGLTGVFSIRTSDDVGGYARIQVEEYKRPTFEVMLDDYKKGYSLGDTLRVSGYAKTFSGVPVSNGKVKYSVTRRSAFYWYWWSDRDEKTVYEGTATTDKDGKFTLNIPLIAPEKVAYSLAKGGKKSGLSYSFNLEVTVTDVAGESQEAEKWYYTGEKRTSLSCDMADKYRADLGKKLRFNYLNIAGTELDGDVKYIIVPHKKGDKAPLYTGKYTTVKANSDVNIDILKSGSYRLHAICGTDTIDNDFLVFALSDKKPVEKTPDWFYISADKFPEDGSPVYVQVGSSDENQHVIYTIYSGNKVLEHGELNQSNTITTRKFNYQTEYGDGIVLNYVWVKNGIAYTHTKQIARSLPKDKLKLSWKTFRNKLIPGQKEEWTLTIKGPDNKPSAAQLLAFMYDKSLDKIEKYYLPAVGTVDLSLPSVGWWSSQMHFFTLRDIYLYPTIQHFSYDFAAFNDELSAYLSPAFSTRMYGESTANPMMMVRAEKAVAAKEMKESPRQAKASAAIRLRKNGVPSNEKPQGTIKFRENLSETAFFYPQLLADKGGNVAINFTLPESLTTWRFVGFAHDKAMNNGTITEDIVAQKKLMIQPNMPRFIREGDEANVESKVTNLSDKAVSLFATMELIDPETDSVLQTLTNTLNLEPGKTTNTGFLISTKALNKIAKEHKTSYDYLIVRQSVVGNGFSDGEQQYLVILPNKELVTTTYPLTIDEKETKSIDLQQLMQRKSVGKTKLTIEYAANPSWLMIQSLPYIGKVKEDNAFDLTAAYYANTLGKAVLNQSPKIKKVIELWKKEASDNGSLQSNLSKNEELKNLLLNETPWVKAAENDQNLRESLINFYDENALENNQSQVLAKLKKLQYQDGGFAWWSGMGGNPCTTTFVVKIFARLQSKLGQGLLDNPATADMLKKALSFLDLYVKEEVKEMKAKERNIKEKLFPDDILCDYLYINALAKRKQTADMAYILNRLSRKTAEATIYGKANTAVILALYGKKQTAKTHLQSLQEYAVSTKEMGKYFDTHKAYYSWRSYKIPTEVAAIEALRLISPADLDIPAMQRWLLQEKRTQLWNTPINTLDAIWAFSDESRWTEIGTDSTTFALDNQLLEFPKATAGLGYVKLSESFSTLPKTLTIKKGNSGMSFGGVYLQYLAEAKDIKAAENGFGLTREIVDEKGETVNVADLKVGDKIKVRLIIEATRDYDFVQIVDKRPACLEPINQTSDDGFGFYCSPRDNQTNYYLDKMAKGTHIIETEYYVDRAGTYTSGTCSVQSAYAPEFSSQSGIYTLNVRK